MAEFLSELDARKIGKSWVLLSSLSYQSDILGYVVIVPENFATDFASVPRLPIAYLLTGDTAHEAAVVHDFLYRTRHCDRKVADNVFLEAMTVTGQSWWRRRLMWAGVRLFGWTAYPKG